MIELRRIEVKDISQFRGERNKPEIMNWCRQNDLISIIDQQAWYQKQNDDPTIKMYSIISNNSLVGCCGLTSIDLINRNAEFSCYIFVDEQRKGFAKAALEKLFNYGFDQLNLHLIWGETVGANPSLKLFTNGLCYGGLCMTIDGVIPEYYYQDGKYVDATRVSIRKKEWCGE